MISHDRRRIVHWNVTTHPKAPWVWRQILAATPWNRHPRFLIRDRDRNYGGGFVSKAAAIGITTVLTPVRAPKANAIAERVIGTIRRECLDHLIVLNERHLRRVLREYLAYYDAVRPHQSLGDEPPAGPRRCHGAPSPNASSVARFSAASTMSTPGKRPDGVLKHHNGPTVFVPGSHRWGRLPFEHEQKFWEDDAIYDVVPMRAKAGSLAVWHGNTWHGALGKTTLDLRVTLVLVWMRAYMKPIDMWQSGVSPELIERYPELRKILGLDHPYPHEDTESAYKKVGPFMAAGLDQFG